MECISFVLFYSKIFNLKVAFLHNLFSDFASYSMKELLLFVFICLEYSTKCQRCCGAALIHDTSCFYAEMGCTNIHCNIVSFKDSLEGCQDLLSESLLHLWSLSEKSHESIEFTQTKDLILWDVSKSSSAVESHKVMLASGGKCDIVDSDHFCVLHFVIDSGDFWKVSIVQSGEDFFNKHFSDSQGGLFDAVISQVHADRLKNLGHTFLDDLYFILSIICGSCSRIIFHDRIFNTTSNQRFLNL